MQREEQHLKMQRLVVKGLLPVVLAAVAVIQLIHNTQTYAHPLLFEPSNRKQNVTQLNSMQIYSTNISRVPLEEEKLYLEEYVLNKPKDNDETNNQDEPNHSNTSMFNTEINHHPHQNIKKQPVKEERKISASILNSNGKQVLEIDRNKLRNLIKKFMQDHDEGRLRHVPTRNKNLGEAAGNGRQHIGQQRHGQRNRRSALRSTHESNQSDKRERFYYDFDPIIAGAHSEVTSDNDSENKDHTDNPLAQLMHKNRNTGSKDLDVDIMADPMVESGNTEGEDLDVDTMADPLLESGDGSGLELLNDTFSNDSDVSLTRTQTTTMHPTVPPKKPLLRPEDSIPTPKKSNVKKISEARQNYGWNSAIKIVSANTKDLETEDVTLKEIKTPKWSSVFNVDWSFLDKQASKSESDRWSSGTNNGKNIGISDTENIPKADGSNEEHVNSPVQNTDHKTVRNNWRHQSSSSSKLPSSLSNDIDKEMERINGKDNKQSSTSFDKDGKIEETAGKSRSLTIQSGSSLSNNLDGEMERIHGKDNKQSSTSFDTDGKIGEAMGKSTSLTIQSDSGGDIKINLEDLPEDMKKYILQSADKPPKSSKSKETSENGHPGSDEKAVDSGANGKPAWHPYGIYVKGNPRGDFIPAPFVGPTHIVPIPRSSNKEDPSANGKGKVPFADHNEKHGNNIPFEDSKPKYEGRPNWLG